MERNLWKRIMIGVSVPAMLVLLCIYEYQGGNGMECMFYRYTGLYCPGCGGTRALIALLRGHPLRSLRLHPLVLPGILWAAAYLGSHLLAASGVRKMPVLRISRRPLIAGIVILAGNFVIKNLCLAAFGIDLLSR